MSVSAYPLQWPDGWPRTSIREPNARFRTTFDDARRKLYGELDKLGATNVVVSSWLPLRQDGHPRADMARRPLADPGVAVYFMLNGKPMVMARDVWRDVHDNMMAIVHAIHHLRGLERHGGGLMVERAFAGFARIDSKPHWMTVLNFPNDANITRDIVDARYRALAKLHQSHHERLVELNLAIEQARKELQ